MRQQINVEIGLWLGGLLVQNVDLTELFRRKSTGPSIPDDLGDFVGSKQRGKIASNNGLRGERWPSFTNSFNDHDLLRVIDVADGQRHTVIA